METLLILFVFAVCPLAVFLFIIGGAVYFANNIKRAKDKYLNS